MPQECIQNKPKPKIISAIKIEDKLMNNHIATKKKLENLKKTLDEELVREIRNKPQITEKSRVLAERAEKRLFQTITETKDPIKKPDHVYVQVQPDLISPVSISKKIDSSLSVRHSSKSVKKRTKSLLNLSVIERNEA